MPYPKREVRKAQNFATHYGMGPVMLISDAHIGDNYRRQMEAADILMTALVREYQKDPNFILVHDEIVRLEGTPTMNDKAYKQGRIDAQIYGMIPTAAMVEKLAGFTDGEAIVSYMNGVGDELVGL